MPNKDEYGNEVMSPKSRETERILRLAAGGGVHEELIAANLWRSHGLRPRRWQYMVSWYARAISRVTGAIVMYHNTKVGTIWQLMDTVPPAPRPKRTASGVAIAGK